MTYNETQSYINLVLNHPSDISRTILYSALTNKNHTEAQFCQAIIEHAPGMNLTTEQWFELLSRLPNRMLRSQLNLPGLISEEQIKKLPPISG